MDQSIEKVTSIQTIVRIESRFNEVIELMQVGPDYHIDSRNVAPNIGIKHGNFIETLETYQAELERFGQLRFQTEVGYRPQGGGNPQKFVTLNRNQVLFAITLSRNTPQVVRWKMALIDALDQLEKQIVSAQLAAPRKRSRIVRTREELEQRILRYAQYNQTEDDLDRIPTIRNFSRYTRATVDVLRPIVESLQQAGLLIEMQAGKAIYYIPAA